MAAGVAYNTAVLRQLGPKHTPLDGLYPELGLWPTETEVLDGVDAGCLMPLGKGGVHTVGSPPPWGGSFVEGLTAAHGALSTGGQGGTAQRAA